MVIFDGRLPLDGRRAAYDDARRWLEEIEDSGVNLSVREQDFIESIGPRVRLGRGLFGP